MLKRAGQTEAGVDLARLAGMKPAAVLCQVLRDDGSVAQFEDLVAVARANDIPLISVADLIAWYCRDYRGLLTDSPTTALFPGPKGKPKQESTLGRQITEKVKRFGLQELEVFVKGVGSGREASVRALANSGFALLSIKDITPPTRSFLK